MNKTQILYNTKHNTTSSLSPTFSPLFSFSDLLNPAVLAQILKTLKGVAGVYAFLNNDTGEIAYVGSSINLGKRAQNHINNKGSNISLQRAFLKYGIASFSFLVLEIITLTDFTTASERKEAILSAEQRYLDQLQPRYNILTNAGSPLGYKQSDEAKAKISAALKGPLNPFFGKTTGREFASGEANPMFGQVAPNAQPVYIYNSSYELVKEFTSRNAAAKWLACSRTTVVRYVQSGALYNNYYLLSKPHSS